jgi:hypothetical protein
VSPPSHTSAHGGHRPRVHLSLGARALVVGVILCAMAASASAQRRRGRRRPPPTPTKPAPPPAPAPTPKPSDGAGVQPAPAPGPAAPDAAPPAAGGKPKVFDFTGLDISGRLRTPQLLYFLDRASEELDRASLQRRSFIPEMVNSIDESKL